MKKKIFILFFLSIISAVNAQTVSTFAGTGVHGSADGSSTFATFFAPMGIAFDASGNLYVADFRKIRKITPDGTVSTIAGTGSAGSINGPAASASFMSIKAIALDASGNVYVIDDNKIRKLSTLGLVSTFAGGGKSFGSVDGPDTLATFSFPTGLTIDKAGNVYVADRSGGKIRKITPAGVVSTLAGDGSQGTPRDGSCSSAAFNYPAGVALDLTGYIYVADQWSHRIRKISANCDVSAYAGNGSEGSLDGLAAAASFDQPHAIAFDVLGNLYVVDEYNHKIRKVSSDGIVSTVAGSGIAGSADGESISASFNDPQGIAIDASGNIYIADPNNYKIRKITLTTTDIGDKIIITRDEAVFPNPVKNTLNIISSFSANTYRITDITGKELLSGNSVNNTIDVSNLSNGVFFINISNEGGLL